MLAEIGTWVPIALVSGSHEYNLLTSNAISNTLIEQQVTGTWQRPDVASKTKPCDCETRENKINHSVFHLQQTSRAQGYLRSRTHIELTEAITELLDEDWMLYPQLRYVTAKLFSGAIMMEGTSAILVNCVEPYGRTKATESHYERRLPGYPSSYPEQMGKYGWIAVKSLVDDGAKKLVVGTRTCNLPVTSSVRIDHQSDHSVEIGPFMANFQPTPNTSIYLDSLSVEASRKLLQDDECFRMERGPFLPQLRQLRSKFHTMSTYTMCRSSSSIGSVMQTLPYTIWTLHDYDSNQTTPSQEKIGSRLFQMVASAVIKDGSKAKLKKQDVEVLMNCVREDIALGVILRSIIMLMEDDFVTIIDNQPLNKRLTELAHLVSGGLQRANKSVMIHVSHRLFP
ncbi:unnamed protein product [Umbelopsis vinacea]